MSRKWRLYGLLGPWHKVGAGRKFRFYIRARRATGKRFYFADYCIEDLTSRHHLIGEFEKGTLGPCYRRANLACLNMTRGELAELEP